MLGLFVMAKKKVEKVLDLEERIRTLRFEDSEVKRNETVEAALKSGRDEFKAPALFHLGVSADDYNLAMKYLHDAKYLFEKTEQRSYANTTWSRIERLKQEKRQKDRSLLSKIFFPFRAAA